MKTLRGRLMAATLVLATVGLIAANLATFTLLRSSLYTRVDHQLLEVAHAPGLINRLLSQPGGSFGGQRGAGGAESVYIMLLDQSGAVRAERFFGFDPAGVRPKLPPALPGNASYRGKTPYTIFSTSAVSGPRRYRVFAGEVVTGGTIILAFPMEATLETLRRLVLLETLVTLGVLGGVAALAYWLIGIGLRPLTQMENSAREIAEGTLSRRVEPSDQDSEVGRLGSALNTMLERIESSFSAKEQSESRLRRFIADASHELRTPLTSIRGYAELFRHGASSRPEDVGKSMRRIEEESARMSVLVDELLLLARLDQGRPLDRAPVDLETILTDAVTDARAVDPNRPITLEIEDALVVSGDEPRLRQVVANLLSNALRHTPAQTAVHVRLHQQGQTAVLEVADEGPGLDSDAASKIFDRFYRVEESRSRTNAQSGGTGLGLSIVAAIIHSLGGSVAVQTAPGAGARFIVSIPILEHHSIADSSV